MQIPLTLLWKNEQHYCLSADHLAQTGQRSLSENALTLDGVDHVMKRRAMLKKVASEPIDLAFERYIGQNDLLPINFLEIGYQRSHSVGRLRFFDLTAGRNAMATGFLISPDLLLTNHHVFRAANTFRDAVIEFDYSFDILGREKPVIRYRLNPSQFFFSSEELDFSLVGVQAVDESGLHPIQERGYLVLNPTLGKIGLGDFASIIQFPEGSWQQVGLRENKLLDISRPNALIYSTDTAEGSSGSPVFNDQWQVIALHSAGVAKKDDQGNYLSASGQIIPVVDGTIDSTQLVWHSNTGIRISSIIQLLTTTPGLRQHPLIQFLLSPNYSDDTAHITRSFPFMGERKPPSLGEVGFPSSAHASGPSTPHLSEVPRSGIPWNVTVRIEVSPLVTDKSPEYATPYQASDTSREDVSLPPVRNTSRPGDATSQQAIDARGDELKLMLEKEQDFTACNGFDTYFLGFETPLPSPSPPLKRLLAPLLTNENLLELKYYHYSTVQHAIRKMPILSAINVDGNPALRMDKTPRKDNWLRDIRIDFRVQLDDEYYKGSHFDKGHMSRREDAKWGDSSQEAERNAQLTCMYTNACPQVPALNRSGFDQKGLWGALEKLVLEQGVRLEQGNSGRISVYNGPIFVSADPVFRGVQTPLRFYKVIVWINAQGTKKTTGFILSQEDLVGDIRYEELQFDKVFLEHQCSIAYLENLTQLTFTAIRSYDTFKADPVNPVEVKRIDEKSIMEHLQFHSGE